MYDDNAYPELPGFVVRHKRGKPITIPATRRAKLTAWKASQVRANMIYDFLAETYATERIKVLSVWSEFHDSDLPFRPNASDARGRSGREQMIHQCVSEDL